MLKFFFKNLVWHLKNYKFFSNFIIYYYYYILIKFLKFFLKDFNSSDRWCEKNISKSELIKNFFLNNKTYKKIIFKNEKKKSAANVNLLFQSFKNTKNIKNFRNRCFLHIKL